MDKEYCEVCGTEKSFKTLTPEQQKRTIGILPANFSAWVYNCLCPVDYLFLIEEFRKTPKFIEKADLNAVKSLYHNHERAKKLLRAAERNRVNKDEIKAFRKQENDTYKELHGFINRLPLKH
jgi:hypothetical protein